MAIVEDKHVEKPNENKRDETLPLKDIDEDYLTQLIETQIREFDNNHHDFFQDREEWLLGLRDLRYQYHEGMFENSADLHVPFSLIMSKALHARVFQTFSQQNFFSVRARNQAYMGREDSVKYFMTWVQDSWINRGMGRTDVLDKWIQNIIDEGSGILKLGWDRWSVKYMDIDLETVESPILQTFADADNLEMEEATETKVKLKNVKKEKDYSAPWINTVELDDFKMPAGCQCPQTSPWVMHRVFLSDDDLKHRVRQKRFNKDAVEEALERRKTYVDRNSSHHGDTTHDTRRRMRELEGVEGGDSSTERSQLAEGIHTIWEWHGKAYITKEMDEDVARDVNESPQDVIVWYHADLRKILGWTYLYRVSPSGRRPFYKPDFIPSKERAYGIGVGELLFSLNNHIDAVHNLKLDNGVLSSLQFGMYRAGSTLKPDTFKLRPGDLVPVEDPNDVKFANFPFLGQFGENEERTLTGYGEKLLALNDINLGNLGGSGVAGALRNATGANFVDRQANIQLHPHLSRIAREYKRLLNDLFILCRSRMEKQIYFRVTGEDGKAIFGDVNAADLSGDFDFDIDTDLASASEAENQQRVSLMLQNLLNPTFMQLGLVQPQNYYEVLKEFLIKHNVRHPDKFITKPPGYTGPPENKESRLLKIITGNHEDPPIENSVRPDENHEVALEFYNQFKEQESFGLLDRSRLAALAAVIAEHEKYLQMTQGGMQGVPNTTGTQMPGEGGLGPLGPQAGQPAVEGGPLGSPMGEPNGPVI